jgi:hypothetical protein
MQDSGFLSQQTSAPSRVDLRHDPRQARAGFSAAQATERRPNHEANRLRGIRPAAADVRTLMLLEQPIASTILRLAAPNATVMLVQILIGLLEVYFVAQTGVDALAGVAPVFPLVSLVVAIAQGALGGGFVTAVARGTPLRSLFRLALRRRSRCYSSGLASMAIWASREMRLRLRSLIRRSSSQAPSRSGCLIS